MFRKLKKTLVIILSALCVLSLTACGGMMVYNKPIELTDLASTYTGEKTDSDGTLLVPFDVAYADAFNSGAYPYEEGHILLKMKKSFNGTRTNELRKCGIASLEKFLDTDSGNWYRAELNGDFEAVTAVFKARSLDSVLIADFDYIYETENTTEEINAAAYSAETESTDVSWAHKDVHDNKYLKDMHHLKCGKIQEGWKFLEDNNKPVGGSSSVVVAVIDTGVDYTHPDLKANMWVNKGEIPGNGIDDDGNGYVDDVYGVNTIADNGGADGNEGDPMDDHGHGTHVAGIIGASNNKEGVVGVAYNAKIMAIKAGQASGAFNQSDIAEGILYAYSMGADVINMSFGGSACSIAVQDALATAYTTASLVAAAGNDGKPNELSLAALPCYPAALPYVIGVMSVDDNGVESVFTNYDVKAFTSIEYEVYAPGEGIMSTLPNGRYGKLSGTSMAAPVVSGAAALLRSYFTDRDMYPSKFIMAQICATSEERAICCGLHAHMTELPMILDIYKAFTNMPKPDVNLYDWYLFDTADIAEGNSGDGVVDAGETIEIGAVLRNRWGMSKNTVVTISDDSELGVDNPYVDIITGSVNYEGVGTYSTKDTLLREGSIITGTELPLVIKIADNCPNDYYIKLTVTITAENALDEEDKTVYSNVGVIDFYVRNGVILPSQITEDMTLTKDNYYIIPNSTYIAEGVTVTVEQGTQIQFYTDDPNDPYADTYIPYLNVAGKFITNGTAEEPVKMFPSDMMGQYVVDIRQVTDVAYVELNYTTVSNPQIDIDFADHCTFNQVYDYARRYRYLGGGKVYHSSTGGSIKAKQVTNSIFYKLGSTLSFVIYKGDYKNCVFESCNINNNSSNGPISYKVYYASPFYENCVFNGNCLIDQSGEKWNSTFAVGAYGVPLVKGIYKNEQTGTTYIRIWNCFGNIYLYRSFAKMMGGDICCIETEEEWQYLSDISKSVAYYSNYDFGVIGYQSHSKYWINGEKINDSFNIIEGSSYYGSIVVVDGESSIAFDTCSIVLLEIPKTQEVEWTEDLILEKYDEWEKKGLNSQLINCAILNNFNDTDVENWLRITASDYGIGDSTNSIGLSGNYWGTTDMRLIEKMILDFDDYQSLADIKLGEILTTAPENTFPFVTDAFILDSNGQRVQTVGNEKIIVVVQFNRDMNTGIDLRVRFGSFYPYADYEVTGEYVSAREWRGTYTLKTTIENGNLFFNIENGEAKEDCWLQLYEYPGRFTFELDTTSAQAMIMQGTATETGINLTWMQDDFDTLLGYNLYRSDKEDGLYVRLNDYVLSQEENTFFDDTVEPGKVYYYNFTVVKTDLTESKPSGKIVIQSMDTMAPNIYHSPVRTAYTGSNLLISATITDNLMVKSAKIYYRAVGVAEWKQTTMNALNSKYTAVIGAENLSLDGLEYYIEAYDGVSYTYKGGQENPYQVTVKLAVDANSLGDVDGDGAITVKDAQMTLMAINDLYNLTEEQFMRADINGDGELQAFEALRILDYVSGKVTTIVL